MPKIEMNWELSAVFVCATKIFALPRFAIIIKKLVESYYCCRLSFNSHRIHKLRARAYVRVCRARAFIRALN